MTDHIRVYRFDDAPQYWRELLCHNGGDEDWLAIVPKSVWESSSYIGWLQNSAFGGCSVNRYTIDEVGLVYYRTEQRGDDGCRIDDHLETCGFIPELANSELFVGCHA